MVSFNGLFGNGNANQRFWQWFETNSNRLAEVKTCQEPIADELSKQLRKVCKGLVFLFGPEDNGRREFIISAAGIRKLFPNVQELVNDAPDMPGWRIMAFRPPVKDISDLRLILGDAEFSANDIWFSYNKSDDKIDLNIFTRIPDGVSRDVVGEAAFLLLDHTVGEYNVETKIGGITLGVLPIDPVAEGLHPLSMLPKIIT